MENEGEETESIYQGCNDNVLNAVDDDDKMSAERFDDALAALTLTATVITIALGFLFNL